jgi:hypothetical protein
MTNENHSTSGETKEISKENKRRYLSLYLMRSFYAKEE